MNKAIITALITTVLLSACGQHEQAAPTEKEKEEALRKFLDRKTTHVRTIEEIHADRAKEKTKEKGNENK